MKRVNPHVCDIRVRYQETDAQGRVHHANYFNYFEIGRVESLRANGVNYRDLEDAGIFLVVVDICCQYFLPAQYDDVLTLQTDTISAKGARVTHHYDLRRGEHLVAKGQSIVACIDAQGKVRRLPSWLRP